MAEEKGKKMIGSYDIKVPEDTDVTLGYDVTANKVKNFKFSGIWTWLISKLKGSSISDLNTRNKTVVGAIKEVNTPTFTTATSRTNINSGESQSIIMGKIKKWLADLGTAAFCSVVNNLTTTAEGSVLDARQGKNLSDALTKLNTLMGSTDISAIGGGTLTGAISELNSKALPRKIFTADNTETDILKWCEELLAKSTLEVYFVFASDLSDKPLSRKYRYSPGLFFHTYDTCVLMFYCYNTREIAIRSKYRNGEWSDWRVI